MRRFLSKLFRDFRSTNSTRGHRSAPRRVTLQVEGLEDRLVPTVVYESALGGDSIFWVPGNSAKMTASQVVTAPISNNPSVLNSTTVYLDFWGDSWTTTNAAPLASAAQSIVQSNFFSQLKDYGFHGTISYGGYTIDNTHTSDGTTPGDPQNGQNPQTEIQNLLNGKLATNASLPTSSWLRPKDNHVQNSPIYIVVYDNGNNAFNNPASYTSSLMMNEISLGDGGNNQDTFTDLFSHEMAERISAGDKTGIEMNATNAHTDGEFQNSQISDNEPDDGNYMYRINGPDGQLVQAYWSIYYNGFVVPDGNRQTVYLNPIWGGMSAGSTPFYTGQANLQVDGGQLTNPNDTITLTENAYSTGNGVSVILNGEVFQFAPGQINNTYVFTTEASSIVNVLATPSGTSTYIDDQGNDSVVVGSSYGNVNNGFGYMGNIQGAVYVATAYDFPEIGATSLYLDDSGDSVGQQVFMYAGSIYYGADAPIFYNTSASATGGVTFLAVDGGFGGNTFNVYGTSKMVADTFLNTGRGNDTVNVHATQGELVDYNNGGFDNTYVGLGTTANLNGSVWVAGSGATSLDINDSSDPYSRTVTMADGSVTGLGSGGIYWSPTSSSFTGGVTSVEVDGGDGLDTFNVNNTSNLAYGTTLYTGSWFETVNVYATQGALYVVNPSGYLGVNVGLGNMGSINGLVDVEGAGTTSLVLNDSSDTTGRTVTIGDGSVTGLAPQGMYWATTSGVDSVTVDGGSAGDTFDINGSALAVPVTVNGSGNSNWLNFDDQSATAAESYTITATAISRSGSANLSYSGVRGVTVNGGNDGNSFSVPGTSASTFVTVNAGTGNDTVTVGNSTDGLGDLNYFGGNVAVNGVAGHTTLVLNDQAGVDGYLLVSNTYASQGFRTIDYSNISNLVVDAQSAGSYEVDVVYTPASMMTTVNAGAGGDLVHLGGTFTGMAGEVLGPVTINGAGNTQVIAYDQRDATAQTYTVTATTFTDSGFALTYSNLASLTINGGAANNVYAIQSTAASMGLIINAGAAGDTVQLGGTSAGIAGNVLGPVTINGAGNTQVIAYDQRDTTAQTYTVTATTFADSKFSLTYSQLASLTIDGGSAFDVYAVQSTAAGTAVNLNGGNGRNTFKLGSGTSLGSLQGAVSVNGGTAASALTANDSNSASGQGYTLSATQLTSSDFAPLNLIGMAALNFTGAAGSTYNIQGTPAGSAVTVTSTGGGANNGFFLDSGSGPGGIQGALTLNGGGTNALQGANVFNTWEISGVNSGQLNGVSFSNFQILVGGGVGNTFQFTNSAASEVAINGGGGITTLDYSLLGSSFPVSVNLATLAAPLITANFANINTLLGSSDPANTLTAGNVFNQWTITGTGAGSVNGVTFSGMDHLVGGTGVDTFQFGASGKVLSINGGGAPAQQGDWLNYSSWASTNTVTVNLATGSASNVNGGAAGAVTNMQNVIGSASGTNKLTGNAQGNILIGGSGTNTLVGGSGASLLIGGSGHGSIRGGSNSDILIAGSMTVNEAALMAVLAELQSADTFAQKVSDILNGNNSGGGSDLNGSNKLTWGSSSPTVKASTGVFALLGKTGATDWFFANASSTVTGFGAQDEHNNNALGVF